MFKFFLKKKLLSSRSGENPSINNSTQKETPNRRNRRIIDRYNVDFKHLTILSDQNILLIKDISAKGFATALPKQSYDRFMMGDVYDGRMRYLGETYDVKARVTWKHKEHMGFEIIRPTTQTVRFLSRLIKPIEIAASLKEVDSNFIMASNENKIWFHGDKDTDLYVWFDSHNELIAWQLCTGEEFLEWHAGDGLKAGQLNQSILDFANPGHSQGIVVGTQDNPHIGEKIQLAQDIVMASSIVYKTDILQTLREK